MSIKSMGTPRGDLDPHLITRHWFATTMLPRSGSNIIAVLGYGPRFVFWIIDTTSITIVTYDHRLMRTGHPVRSAILKHQIGRLVVGWVTTSESLLLYVFCFSFSHVLMLWRL